MTARVTERQLAVLRLAKDGRSLYADVEPGGKPGRSNTISTMIRNGLLGRRANMSIGVTSDGLRVLEDQSR